MGKLSHYINPAQIVRDKREYRALIARVNALPEDYRFVYKKIQDYQWKFAAGGGLDMVELQADLLELFEEGAAAGKHVLDITGEDVAAFSDELLANAATYIARWREDLNEDVAKKLGASRDGSKVPDGA